MPSPVRLSLLLGVVVGLPMAAWFGTSHLPSLRDPPVPFSGGRSYPASSLAFSRAPCDLSPPGLPCIANVQILDFDRDGQSEVLYCDASRSRIGLMHPAAAGSWTETLLIRDLAAPAHAAPVDIDRDGDLDLAVAVLGNILPDDSVIGRVELYEQLADGFARHVILDDVRRVADVQPADFDGDGDIDLAVAVFGYARGAVLWLENCGEWRFRDHELLNAPGTIHVPPADYDGDGDIDIAAIVTQDEEELWGFENLGEGRFQPRQLWQTLNFDLGGAGLVQNDLDRDGDPDLILPAGDNLEDLDAYPQPWHGCYWFENRADWQFTLHRISDLGGTYAADAGDLDRDGDVDLVLAGMTNNWNDPTHASLVWLENDGRQQFTTWQIAAEPIHLVTVAIGDLDGDGRPDLAAGALNLRRPYQRIGRVAAWLNHGATPE